MSKGNATSVYLMKEVKEEIEKRGENRSEVICRDLERLYTMYRRTMRRQLITIEEACLLTDLLNATLSTADSAHMLWGSVLDGCKFDKLDEKWGVDGEKLTEKVKNMHEFECMALIDCAERFLEEESKDDISNNEETFEDRVRRIFVIN